MLSFKEIVELFLEVVVCIVILSGIIFAGLAVAVFLFPV